MARIKARTVVSSMAVASVRASEVTMVKARALVSSQAMARISSSAVGIVKD